ncbi:Protein kinase-like domain-containing protein [Cynara cardunculus var. scolymus]|uniref:Protein kinase-like domain-containing protein n=1 Tax=Cynara cardunculus var. scolymus TaxID=59895 RepID=A0A103XJD2_CYNCS|nr:Protein kinase-like domain-containing protein [Cynara cardunculus var. scolymus]
MKDVDRVRLQSKESSFSPKPGSSNKIEFHETVNVRENNCDTFINVLDGKNNARVGTSEHACTSSRCTDSSGVMVEELTVRNFNNGKFEIVGASSIREGIQNGNMPSGTKPGVWEDSDSIFFSEFLDKKQEDQNQNETIDDSPPSPSNTSLSLGGIRTKILSKSGFSEFFVKNTLKGKGVICRGPPRDGVGVHIRGGQSDPRPAVAPNSCMGGVTVCPSAGFVEPRPDVSLREWLKNGGNKGDKSKSLHIFKQILELVDSSHSRGIALHALRPSCFKLLPSNQVLYLGSPAQKEFMETDDDKEILHMDNRDEKRQVEQGVFDASLCSKRRKHGDNWSSFGRWRQIPNLSGSNHSGSNHGRPRAFSYGFNEESSSPHISNTSQVLSSFSSNLLEEQWYTSPEDLRERCSTLSSNIYSLGVLLFELLGSFESAREHAFAMMNLRQRILPPSFLSENPKEAGYCLWLLHPEALARPTTRDILKSKLVSEIEEISTDELLSSVTQDDIESELLLHFLVSLEEQKQICATKLVEDINCIESDIAEVELRRAKQSHEPIETSLILENKSRFGLNITSSPFSTLSESRLISNLGHLESAYYSVRSEIEVSDSDSTNSNDHEVFRSRENYNGSQMIKAEKKPLDRLGIFFNGLCKYARYSKFEVRGNLRGGDFSSSANVICSLGFDRDEDYFATAGVSKKIKVYDFHLLLNDSVDIHYPAVEMANKSRLSCICWNSYIKNYLASTDYDGMVKIWDAGTGQAVSHHIEHERRAWSVDFSRVDPTKLASGSDDCCKNSTSTIRNIANVCCVQFSPYSAHLLSFGSADYRTYCYDLRNVSAPLCILAGHDRAVSYVKFIDSETIVSASTDNTLKLWDLKKTSVGCSSTNGCILTFRGHTNEKNFVGLSVADGYIACGSETNEFGSIDPVSGKETDNGNNQFVSSVCWRQKSDMVIAANSSGCLKLLQMSSYTQVVDVDKHTR